jgi:hypothetical protein
LNVEKRVERLMEASFHIVEKSRNGSKNDDYHTPLLVNLLKKPLLLPRRSISWVWNVGILQVGQEITTKASMVRRPIALAKTQWDADNSELIAVLQPANYQSD